MVGHRLPISRHHLLKIQPVGTRVSAPLWLQHRFWRIKIASDDEKTRGGGYDETWPFLHCLIRGANRAKFTAAMSKAGIKRDEYDTWEDIVRIRDLTDAISSLVSRGLIPAPAPTLEPVLPNALNIPPPTPPYPPQSNPLPPWLLLYLVSNKVRSRRSAEHLTPFVLSHLDSILPLYKHPFLILAASNLNRWSIQHPLGHIIQAFIHTPFPSRGTQTFFNLLLGTLASSRKTSVLLSQYIIRVLETMRERQIPLHTLTCTKLLKSEVLTIELTKMLRERMIAEGRTPSREHLEGFLRFFSKTGQATNAAHYLEVIRKRGFVVPTPKGSLLSEDTDGEVTKENLLYLKALQDDPESAFGYLAKLSSISSHPATIPPKDLRHPDKPGGGTRSTHAGVPKHQLSISAFRTMSRAHGTTSERLIRVFRSMKRFTSARHKRTWYTIAIQGLLLREEVWDAKDIFLQFISEEENLDRVLLSAGVKAIALGGSQWRAFKLLMERTYPSTEGELHRSPAAYSIPCDIAIINSLLHSMDIARRPDVVFAIWDRLESVFGLRPDDITMSYMLDTARFASTGAYGRVSPRGEDEASRAEVPKFEQYSKGLQDITSLFSHSNSQNAISGTWNGEIAWRHARLVFKTMLFRSFPQLADDTSSSSSSWKFWQRTSSPLSCTNWEFPLSSKPFAAYIRMLASLSLGQEIPEVLRWMVVLDVPLPAELVAMASVAWEDHNSTMEGVMGRTSGYHRIVQWLKDCEPAIEDRWPTERDFWEARRKLFYERKQARQ